MKYLIMLMLLNITLAKAQVPKATSISGEQTVRLNSSHIYTVHGLSQGVYVRWEAKNGRPSVAYGESASIRWNNMGKDYSLSVYVHFMDSDKVMDSAVIYPKVWRPDSAMRQIAGPETVYSGGKDVFSSGMDSYLYEWAIFPDIAGSVSAGDGTRDVEVQWNTVPQDMDVVLKVKTYPGNERYILHKEISLKARKLSRTTASADGQPRKYREDLLHAATVRCDGQTMPVDYCSEMAAWTTCEGNSGLRIHLKHLTEDSESAVPMDRYWTVADTILFGREANLALAAGKHDLSLTFKVNESWCTVSRALEVPHRPVAKVKKFESACASPAVQFTDSSSRPELITAWDWDFNDLTHSPLQHPVHNFQMGWIAPAMAYNIKLTTTDIYDCKSSDSMVLTVVGGDEMPLIIVPRYRPDLCHGDSGLWLIQDAMYRSNGPYHLTWSDGSTEDSLYVTDVGRYWVQTIDRNGCVAYSYPIDVTKRPEVPLYLDNMPLEYTQNSPFTLQVKTLPAFDYAWEVADQRSDSSFIHVAALERGDYQATIKVTDRYTRCNISKTLHLKIK